MADTSPDRSDGRAANQIRPLAAEPGALSRADGSSRFSHDGTEVLVAVYGPCEAKRSRERIDGSAIEVIVRPRMGIPGPIDRELEQLVSQSLQHLVLVAMHPRTAVSVVVQVLADDGALVSTALHGACVALMHAGVPLRGMLAGCAIAILPDGAMLLDPSAAEEAEAQAVVTLAYLLRQRPDCGTKRQLLLSHMVGGVAPAQFDVCEKAAQEAAASVALFIRQSLERSVASLAAEDELEEVPQARPLPLIGQLETL